LYLKEQKSDAKKEFAQQNRSELGGSKLESLKVKTWQIST